LRRLRWIGDGATGASPCIAEQFVDCAVDDGRDIGAARGLTGAK
jgi:hypothetical protein